MLIAIISDIHDNLANLEKCLNWLRTKKISVLLCGGDITNEDTLDFLASSFQGKIMTVTGNADLFTEKIIKKYSNLKYYGHQALIKIAKLNIGLCHEPSKIASLLKQKLQPPADKLDYIFYGHTHKPWLEKKDGVIVANPGNLAGLFHQATFATLDTATKKLELRILADL